MLCFNMWHVSVHICMLRHDLCAYVGPPVTSLCAPLSFFVAGLCASVVSFFNDKQLERLRRERKSSSLRTEKTIDLGLDVP